MNLYYFGSEKKALLRSERLRQKRRLKEEACLGNLPERVGKAGGGLFGLAVTQAQPLAFPCNSNRRLAFLGQHKRKPEFPVVMRETRRKSRKIMWFPVLQDEALAPYSISREVSHSVLKCKTVLGTLDATPKVPLYTDLTRGDTEVPGTTSTEAFLLS